MLFTTSAPSRSRRIALLVGIIVLSVWTSGCLEAGAAVADGGSTGDSGTTHPADTGTGSHMDATTGMDSTMPTGDTSMPVPEAAAEGGVVVPKCMNPSAALTGCFACVDTSCAASAGPAVAACGPFYTCFQACACSDSTCIDTCVMNAPMACQSALGTLNMCQTTTCKAACVTSDGGTTPGDSSTTGDAGSTCKNPTATQLACASCDESKCASDLSASKTACPQSFYTCFDACDCSSTSCIDACAEAAPSACRSALGTLSSCQTSSCNTACTVAPTDGGTKDGAVPAIPDCKSDPDETLYDSCVTCDGAHCSGEVSAALSACSAYYACYSTTDCSTALTVCAADSTSACDTAASNLADCQNVNCIGSCP